MGVSFKVSRTGRRPFPKSSSSFAALRDDDEEASRDIDSRVLYKNGSFGRKAEDHASRNGKEDAGVSRSLLHSDPNSVSAEDEVSFTLNLFSDGYSIGKPLEDVSKSLRPYGRISQNFFSAIECGQLPGDLLDAFPCKFVDGSVICEVRDYRNPASEQGSNIQNVVSSPDVMKVRLQMSLENVVKDIPSISDGSWSYGDLMEVESRILKALQPQLCLDPTPKLDRICKDPIPSKLNMALSSVQKKRMRHVPEISVTSNNKSHGKKICIDRAPERPDYKLGEPGTVQASALQQLPEMNAQEIAAGNAIAPRQKGFLLDVPLSTLPIQQRYPMLAANSRGMQDRGPMPTGQDMIISYSDNSNSSALIQGKRELQEGQVSPMSNLNKRPRLAHGVPEGISQQQLGMQAENFHGSEITLNNVLLHQHLMARGKQYSTANMQKFPQQAFDGMLNAEISGAGALGSGSYGVRYGPKEEQFDSAGKMDSADINRNKPNVQTHEMEKEHMDPQQVQFQQKFPNQAYMRHGFPQAVWNNVNNQHMEHNLKREEPISRRKSAQSPRVSGGALPQSPLSSKSGEFSSGSVGQHYNVVAAPSAPAGVMQKEKGVINSVPPVGGLGSMTSGANDSIQRPNQAQTAASKRRQNSLPKTQVISGVGSPASVSTMNLPLNANSPSIGTPPLGDQSILDRFSKIMVNMRRPLNRKKKASDHPVKNQGAFSADNLILCLHNTSNNEVFKDDSSEMPLSKSIIGGSMNVYKIRVMNLAQQDPLGNIVPYSPRPRTRMIMSDKPNDGTVAVHYGDLDDGDILASEEFFPTLPNTHMADLLAAQFKSLMSKEGCSVDDHVQLKPTRTNIPGVAQQNPPPIPSKSPAVDMPQNNEGVSAQPSGDMSNMGNMGNASVNIQRMLPPGNTQALQMAQPSLAQQPPPQQGPTSNQNPLNHPQLRSHMMLAKNTISQLNATGQNAGMQLANQMLTNKASPLHLQMLQQPQQLPQQQQAQIQRKMMGIGSAMGMGNMGNNLVGLGNLGNAMGMGTGRGIGGPGVSAPMGQISSIGNIGQNPMNMSQATGVGNSVARIQTGALTAGALSKIRMIQSRGMFGTQSGIGGFSGVQSIHPGSTGLSMLGPGLNRASMNLMQRAVGSMGPPRLMTPGMNVYMNQQQMQLQPQQQMQLQQQQMQMPQQPQQQQQQQQQVQMPQQQQQQQQQMQMQMQQQPQESSSSPLQAVISPPQQVGSPQTMAMSQFNAQPQQPQPQQQQVQQQQSSPQQQMSQRTPMSPPQQMSSGGAMHAMSAGNPEGCPPASPQLSSQTLGSVGSITNSPMEMQGCGTNKGNLGGGTT